MNNQKYMGEFSLHKDDKKLAILIDPDKHSADELFDLAQLMNEIKPDFILLGGSLIVHSNIAEAAQQIKAVTDIPLVLFPGHFTHLTHEVDFVLLLSLISGRNPDLLIGQHVMAAPMIKKLGAKIQSTGYMLVDGGKPTSVSYMSNTQPIPTGKTDIAISTAVAGQFIGMKYIYMDAGSGASNPISEDMIRSVASNIDIPLIIGGGLKSISMMETAWSAGANLVVIGNAVEEREDLRLALVEWSSRQESRRFL